MFVDEATITVKGGRGGAGDISFFGRKGGPCGGNGGKGGNVWAMVNPNLSDLKKFTENSVYTAGNGMPGGHNRKKGADGLDLVLNVPLGTVFTDKQTGEEITLDKTTLKIMLCRGGYFGRGNDAFKTSTNQSPRIAEPGLPGQERHFKIVLKLIADYGLIGLPNAGKSSILNILTKANVKTANYPFTTLEANLGAYDDKIIADIPGLIEGASKGRGLGIKFLKHIEKVRLLLHCISAESENLLKDYQTILTEIGSYNKDLLTKKSLVLLTKIDLITKESLKKKIAELRKVSETILPISIFDNYSIENLKKFL